MVGLCGCQSTKVRGIWVVCPELPRRVRGFRDAAYTYLSSSCWSGMVLKRERESVGQ
jgi:hypothetical protein